MTIRKLKMTDVFAVCRILKVTGLREELQSIAKRLSGEDDVESVGLNTLVAIMECLSEKKAEAMLYELIGDICGLPCGEVADLPPQEFFAILGQIAQENDLRAFFASVSAIGGKSSKT